MHDPKEISMSTGKSIIKKASGFTAEEKAAMRARAKEMKAEADRAEGEKAALAAIAGMEEPDRTMATRIHAVIRANAPKLSAKTWYGMPAYANPEGKIVCYFRDRQKFKERYPMLGFNDAARLDDGVMWPVSFALAELTGSVEERIAALVKKAAG
jgi:uncharacterized protein YdhG (YjbR/CyaY superfamily)